MPLISDADAIYRGGSPVDAVYAGDVKVWPTGPPNPLVLWLDRVDPHMNTNTTNPSNALGDTPDTFAYMDGIATYGAEFSALTSDVAPDFPDASSTPVTGMRMLIDCACPAASDGVAGFVGLYNEGWDLEWIDGYWSDGQGVPSPGTRSVARFDVLYSFDGMFMRDIQLAAPGGFRIFLTENEYGLSIYRIKIEIDWG